MADDRRPPGKRNKRQIKVRVHYPTTEEGKKLYTESYAKVVLDILEEKIGADRLDQLIEYMKKKINYKQ
ncbi:hypothetical protein FDG50_01860 [Clostridium botulinum]|uniref:hypothetical protein n=1 Tax=Clostridium botulinum TaxID=1491 RepID=UPI0013FE519F|nr:hypothetical protein [Clostridium botulinum]MBY6836274.1 hypothetical protein [Clostridium botulinum]NFG63664.1 hypothetical protein [Clostridium botulinum]NFQ22891.1 hypothetical protein [Clostridium botulinum]